MNWLARRKANPPPMPGGGEAPSSLLPYWDDLPPEIRAGKEHDLRELWDGADYRTKALLLDLWADGWTSGYADRSHRRAPTRFPLEPNL